jgi:hypothetical protein
MKYNHIGIPTTARFAGEIDVPHLAITISDHQNNAFGIQWQRYWEGASYPELVKTVPHVAFDANRPYRPTRSLSGNKSAILPAPAFKSHHTPVLKIRRDALAR